MLQPISHPRKETRQKLKLRTATFADYPQIAELESRYALDPRSYEQWTHLWQANPVYMGLQRSWEIGWVVEDDRRRIVGSLGNIPLPYELGGNPILAASGRGLVVEPEYRSSALLLLGRLIEQPGIDLYLNTTIGSTSADSFSAFECRRVPLGRWDQAAFWITNPRAFSERLLRPKMHGAAKPVSYPLAAADFVWDRIARRRWGRIDVEVNSCEVFDERFDAFWEELRKNHPARLLAVRTKAVLQWHFEFALSANRLWIATVMDGRRMVACALFERKDNLEFGITRMRLVDFQSLDGGSALLPFLSWALDKCRAEGIHVLEATGRWLEPGELIHRIAPHRRKLSTWTYFYQAHNRELAEHLQHPGAWDPSLYDGDATL